MVSLDLWAIYGLRIITVPAGSSTALPAGKSQLKLNTEQGEIQIIIVLKTRKVSQVNQDTTVNTLMQSNWINSSHFEVPKKLVKLSRSHIKLKTNQRLSKYIFNSAQYDAVKICQITIKLKIFLILLNCYRTRGSPSQQRESVT